MTHLYHPALPGFDARQVWHDGCPECELRGLYPRRFLGTLDTDHFRLAWCRAANWNDGKEVGRLSHAETGLLLWLCEIQIALQRLEGWPMGEVPSALPKVGGGHG